MEINKCICIRYHNYCNIYVTQIQNIQINVNSVVSTITVLLVSDKLCIS